MRELERAAKSWQALLQGSEAETADGTRVVGNLRLEEDDVQHAASVFEDKKLPAHEVH